MHRVRDALPAGGSAAANAGASTSSTPNFSRNVFSSTMPGTASPAPISERYMRLYGSVAIISRNIFFQNKYIVFIPHFIIL